jgi:hypothetical protein
MSEPDVILVINLVEVIRKKLQSVEITYHRLVLCLI